MRVATLAAVLITSIVIASSCGGPPNVKRSEGQRNDITALWSQIREWRREAGMELDPHPQTINQYLRVPVKQARAVCPSAHEVTESCSNVCTLAEHICDNAEQICILADELGKNDTWAQDKCASAKASCREAKQNCCKKCSVSKATKAW